MTLARRILGPNHNRLLIVVEDEVAQKARDNHGRFTGGVVGHTVAAVLLNSEWKDYTGPARTEQGWVIPGSDSMLTPRSYRWKR